MQPLGLLIAVTPSIRKEFALKLLQMQVGYGDLGVYGSLGCEGKRACVPGQTYAH